MDTHFGTGILALETISETIRETEATLEKLRQERNDLIVDALTSGLTYTKVQKATKLSRAGLIKIRNTTGDPQ